jgi:Ni/Co efflux regulator RcnB
MKKFIALLISASIIAAPVAFADEQMGNQDATMQQMTGNDQATPAAKPAKKARHSCHCKKGCAHKKRSAKKMETETETTTTTQQ